MFDLGGHAPVACEERWRSVKRPYGAERRPMRALSSRRSAPIARTAWRVVWGSRHMQTPPAAPDGAASLVGASHEPPPHGERPFGASVRRPAAGAPRLFDSATRVAAHANSGFDSAPRMSLSACNGWSHGRSPPSARGVARGVVLRSSCAAARSSAGRGGSFARRRGKGSSARMWGLEQRDARQRACEWNAAVDHMVPPAVRARVCCFGMRWPCDGACKGVSVRYAMAM